MNEHTNNNDALLARIRETLQLRCGITPAHIPSQALSQTTFHTFSCVQIASALSPVLLMVSGGSDSAALAYLAADLCCDGAIGPCAILHVNHHLRGDAADADEAFVDTLAQCVDMPCFSVGLDVYEAARESGENIEALARTMRYGAAFECLADWCRVCGMTAQEGIIMTAHTQDDRVENFYMRSIVGTGPGGFRSMKYRSGQIARPLLDVSREDLRACLRAMDASGRTMARTGEGDLWCTDATNADTDRFRAFVRHEIIPLAKSRNPRLLDTLGRSMNLIADEDDFIEGLASKAFDEHVRWSSGAAIAINKSLEADLTEVGKNSTEVDTCILLPSFGKEPTVIARRVVFSVLHELLGYEQRIETASVDAVLGAFDQGRPKSGYVTNIQGNLAISSNKQGVRIEPMEQFRARRKKN